MVGRRTLACLIILCAGIIVSAYSYVYKFFTGQSGLQADAGAACRMDSSEKKQNPNETLFISCGGFL